MASLNNLFQCDFLVFIAGIRVPDARITLTSSMNAVPTCNIAIPPYPELFGIGRQDRVPVQIFMSDTLTGKSTVTDLEAYQLLFDGELTDFGYMSSEHNRSFVINAEALPGFLKDIQIDLLTTTEDKAKASIPSAALNGVLLAGHTKELFPASLFSKGLAPSGKANQNIDFPTDFLDNVVDYLTSGSATHNSLMLQFYSTFLTKVNFANRYVRVPFFDDTQSSWSSSKGNGFPLLQGMQNSTCYEIFAQMAGSVPKKASLYALINYILSAMEYEWAFFSAPSMHGGKLVQNCLKPLMYEALPPSCNIITRAMNSEISMHEKVADVPTRIRFRDLHDPALLLARGEDSFLTDLSVMSYFPHGTNKKPGVLSVASLTAAELMTEDPYCELYSGPKVADLLAPPWLSYTPYADSDTPDVLCDNVMKHMYFLKRYETRRMSATMAFNPYITTGFPAIIYDAHGTDISVIGHVLSVQHSISKDSMSTQVELGYARVLSEELENRLENVLKVISDEVTHQTAPMTEIYTTLLGEATFAVPLGIEPSDLQQSDPLYAYALNRRELATLADYVNFMPEVDGFDSNGAHLMGAYYTDRKDSKLRDKLAAAFSADSGFTVFK